jgi:hypothetical protein
MAARQNQEHMTSLTQMGSQKDSPLYWVDKTSPGGRAQELIDSLPLRLPMGETYAMSIRGSTLVISGTQNGITAYRIAGSHAVSGIEGTSEGTLISIEIGNGIRQVLLMKESQPLPRHAVNHSSVDAPLNLLDEYAQLRTQEQARELSRAEQKRKIELLGEIGSEYKRMHRQTESAPGYSNYSTPSTSGESRGGGRNRAG